MLFGRAPALWHARLPVSGKEGLVLRNILSFTQLQLSNDLKRFMLRSLPALFSKVLL